MCEICNKRPANAAWVYTDEETNEELERHAICTFCGFTLMDIKVKL